METGFFFCFLMKTEHTKNCKRLLRNLLCTCSIGFFTFNYKRKKLETATFVYLFSDTLISCLYGCKYPNI